MNRPLPRIRSVSAEGPSTIHVRWRGNGDARIDLAGWIATGGDILAPLRSPELFGHAHVAGHGTAVAWDDDDLMIDAAHLEELALQQQPFDRAHLVQWQLDHSLSNQEAADFLHISLSTYNGYKAGNPIPAVIGMVCRMTGRDPLLLQAHFRPRRPGRPRKTAAGSSGRVATE